MGLLVVNHFGIASLHFRRFELARTKERIASAIEKRIYITIDPPKNRRSGFQHVLSEAQTPPACGCSIRVEDRVDRMQQRPGSHECRENISERSKPESSGIAESLEPNGADATLGEGPFYRAGLGYRA